MAFRHPSRRAARSTPPKAPASPAPGSAAPSERTRRSAPRRPCGSDVGRCLEQCLEPARSARRGRRRRWDPPPLRTRTCGEDGADRFGEAGRLSGAEPRAEQEQLALGVGAEQVARAQHGLERGLQPPGARRASLPLEVGGGARLGTSRPSAGAGHGRAFWLVVWESFFFMPSCSFLASDGRGASEIVRASSPPGTQLRRPAVWGGFRGNTVAVARGLSHRAATVPLNRGATTRRGWRLPGGAGEQRHFPVGRSASHGARGGGSEPGGPAVSGRGATAGTSGAAPQGVMLRWAIARSMSSLSCAGRRN